MKIGCPCFLNVYVFLYYLHNLSGRIREFILDLSKYFPEVFDYESKGRRFESCMARHKSLCSAGLRVLSLKIARAIFLWSRPLYSIISADLLTILSRGLRADFSTNFSTAYLDAFGVSSAVRSVCCNWGLLLAIFSSCSMMLGSFWACWSNVKSKFVLISSQIPDDLWV